MRVYFRTPLPNTLTVVAIQQTCKMECEKIKRVYLLTVESHIAYYKDSFVWWPDLSYSFTKTVVMTPCDTLVPCMLYVLHALNAENVLVKICEQLLLLVLSCGSIWKPMLLQIFYLCSSNYCCNVCGWPVVVATILEKAIGMANDSLCHLVLVPTSWIVAFPCWIFLQLWSFHKTSLHNYMFHIQLVVVLFCTL